MVIIICSLLLMRFLIVVEQHVVHCNINPSSIVGVLNNHAVVLGDQNLLYTLSSTQVDQNMRGQESINLCYYL